MSKLSDYPIDESITRFRKAARHYVRYAQALEKDGKFSKAAEFGSLASMYFTLALDAKHFGDLPDGQE
jgi:hypothetical protein